MPLGTSKKQKKRSTVITLRMQEHQLVELDELAEKLGTDRSGAIRLAITRFAQLLEGEGS